MRLDETELRRWGNRIGAAIRGPVFIALSGPLGAGKSVLARAIGEGAGVREAMPSPSYNLLFRYPASEGRELIHLDLYRLTSPDEVWELGWAQLGAEGDVVLVEWPERADGVLPNDYWSVRLDVPDAEVGLRDVSVRRVGAPPDLPDFPSAAAPR